MIVPPYCGFPHLSHHFASPVGVIGVVGVVGMVGVVGVTGGIGVVTLGGAAGAAGAQDANNSATTIIELRTNQAVLLIILYYPPSLIPYPGY